MGKVIMSGIVPTLKAPVTYNANFADNDWATIIKACHKNQVPETWVVGNQKAMTINGAAYVIDIIGKNHDDYADGSGKAPLTFQLHDCYADTKPMNSANTNSGWKSCDMRQTHLPAILALMPAEVQSGIRQVIKPTSQDASASGFFSATDKLFLLSEIEVFGSITYSRVGEGAQYDYYKAGNSKVKNRGVSANAWWGRSPDSSYSGYFCYVGSSGTTSSRSGRDALGVAFGFCF